MKLIFKKMFWMGHWKLIEPNKLDPYECLALHNPNDVINFIEFKNKNPLTREDLQKIFNQIKEGKTEGKIND